MARYDKYDPISGGYRAQLNADLTATEDTGTGNPLMVSLNASGKVVVGAALATTPGRGVLCTTKNMKAGDVVDVMTDGEVVEMSGTAAGAIVTGVTTTGVTDDVAVDATHLAVGYTVESTRMVVRV